MSSTEVRPLVDVFSHRGPATPRTLRLFGTALATVLTVFALWPWAVRGGDVRPLPAGAAAVLLLIAAARPTLLRPVHRYWMPVAGAIARTVNRVVLLALFYLFVTPVALVRRNVGRSPVARTFDRGLETYRLPKTPRAASHMRHLF